MRRWFWRSMHAALAFTALGSWFGAGCGGSGSSSPAPLATDAGAHGCEPGTAACSCDGNGNCNPGLLCIVGRCLGTEGEPDPGVSSSPAGDLRPALSSSLLDAGSGAGVGPRDAATPEGAADASSTANAGPGSAGGANTNRRRGGN